MDKDKNTKLTEEEINEKMKLFKQNPIEFNAILTTLLLNPSSVDLTLFQKNITTIAKKILLITKEQSKDLYQSLSCIYGAFLGDAMGSYCEFFKYSLDNYKSIFVGLNNFNFEAGQITDDSEMALSMAYGIMDSPNPRELNQDILYFYYGLWRSTGPFDIGRTTSAALKYFDLKNTDISKNLYSNTKKVIATATGGSLSNGFMMRLSPFVVWFYYLNKQLITEVLLSNTSNDNDKENYGKLFTLIKDSVRLDNQMTHWESEVPTASAVFVFMALCAILGKGPNDILSKVRTLISDDELFSKYGNKIVKDHIETALSEFGKDTFNREEYMKAVSTKHIGYYLHGFNLTLYYLYFYDTIKPYTDTTTVYRQIMNEICNWGGDTDTNAAIVGTVLGPIIGFSNFGINDLSKFLNHFSQRRYAYSSAMIYFFMQFLESPEFNTKTTEIRFNFIRTLLLLLNIELN